MLAVPLATVLSDAAAQQLLGHPVSRADLTRHVLTPGGLAALASQAPPGWAQLAAAALAMPSLYESLSIVLLEAWSQATPGFQPVLQARELAARLAAR